MSSTASFSWLGGSASLALDRFKATDYKAPCARAVQPLYGACVMQIRFSKLGGVLLLLAGLLWLSVSIRGQEPQPSNQQQAAAAELPPVPQGVEVLARGPVHEAFATPTTEPVPTKPVAKEPPKPLDEMPPAEKPE